ncbi:MAG: PAS domain-containing protein, partial [Nitrospinae bacterium]|nr:PAS domain-containing protein [Nitrospinota bacterium]
NFRNLAEGSIQGILIQRDQKPLFINRAFAEMLGYESPEEIYRLGTLAPLLAPEDRKRLTAYRKARMKGDPAPAHYEGRAMRKDGSQIWLETLVSVVEWEGQPAILATGVDISERKRMEDALKNSERIMKTAEQVAHFGSTEWDIVENKQFWSDEIFRILGREPQSFEPSEKAFADILHPEDRKRVLLAMSDAVREGGTFEIECRIVRPDGTHRALLATGEVFRDESGKPLRMTGTTQDITERRHLEVQLHHAQKMEAIGTLAGGVAVEVRASAVPVIEGTWPLAEAGIVPGGTERNLSHVEPHTVWPEGMDETAKLVLADAQTSGGLLIGVPEERADGLLKRLADADGSFSTEVIGRVTHEEAAGTITVLH